MLFAVLSIGHMTYCSCKMFKSEITSGSLSTCLTLLNLILLLSSLILLLTFSVTIFNQCVKHLTKTPFLFHQSEENFVRLFFISVLQFEKLMETGSLYLGPLHSSFLNLLFWTICMSPLTICPWFGSVNDDVVQLQGKLIILSKMSLVSNVFINSLWLTILDRIVLVNVYTVEIYSVLLKCAGKFFFTFLSFIILLMFIMSMPLFTKCNFIKFFGLVLVVLDAGGL